MTAQTILRISTVLSESILLMKYETRRRSRLRISHPAQVDVHLKEEGGGGGGGTGATSTSAMGEVLV